jgi:putative transposase
MDNHVHLILVPETADSLRAALAEAHRRYSSRINAREGWTGYLFQGRFASYPMDDAHLMAAVRYVEQNPVAAGLVAHAPDWRWSSARSHVAGRRMAGDPLTNVAALGAHVRNWKAMLRHGLEASDLGPAGEAVADAIEARIRTGRPLAAEAWIQDQEKALDRKLAPGKRGPKPRISEQA